jgi:Ser/Thr protein kinase RdoA (MazF antagonist)
MANDLFPVHCSILSGRALAARLLPHYPLLPPLRCRLLHHGDNDSYRVDSRDARFVLRVWTHEGHTPAAIEAEMAILDQLARHDLPVARPVKRRPGSYARPLPAPEGPRYAGLFAFADGQPPGKRIAPDWSMRGLPQADAVCSAYLRGYNAVRRLSSAEEAAILRFRRRPAPCHHRR